MDVLTDLLERSRARGAAFAQTTGRGRWGVSFATGPGLAVHVAVDGDVHLWPEGRDAEALHLSPGDVVMVRGDLAHRMAYTPGAHCIPLDRVLAAGPQPGSSRRFVTGDDELPSGARRTDATFFCGAYLFEGDLCNGLLAALPDLLHVRPAAGSSLRSTLDLMAIELRREAPGQQTLLDRLLDVALVQIIRDHLGDADEAPAWFSAGSDPFVADALRSMHADPGRHWSVADLASAAGLSRAAFARRFTAAMGEAPLSYLTNWRMALAREQLRTSDDGLATIATTVGYASEFAFAAAFKRHHGSAPGRWRTHATAGH